MQPESLEFAGAVAVVTGLAILGTLAAILLAMSTFQPLGAEGPYRHREVCVCREAR